MASLQKLRRRHHTCGQVFSNQCPRLVKKCCFTIPFEGLDHYPRVSKQKKWNSTAWLCPPRPSPSTGVGILTPCSRLWLRHASVSKLQTLQAAISVAKKCSGAREIADVCGVLSQLLSSELLCTHRWQTLLIGTVEVAVQNTLGTQDLSSPAHPTDVLRDSMAFWF